MPFNFICSNFFFLLGHLFFSHVFSSHAFCCWNGYPLESYFIFAESLVLADIGCELGHELQRQEGLSDISCSTYTRTLVRLHTGIKKTFRQRKTTMILSSKTFMTSINNLTCSVYSDSSNSDDLKLLYLVFHVRNEQSNHNYCRNSVALGCVD